MTQLAAEFGTHRTTVAAHLDRKGVPRRSEATVWDNNALREAAELYAAGRSLADVANRFGVDAQTVANRFKRAAVSVRRRRGWNSQTGYDVHRTTVAAHLDRHQVPRHRKQTARDNEAPGRQPSPT